MTLGVSEDSVDIYDGLDVGVSSTEGNFTTVLLFPSLESLQETQQTFCFASGQTVGLNCNQSIFDFQTSPPVTLSVTSLWIFMKISWQKNS